MAGGPAVVRVVADDIMPFNICPALPAKVNPKTRVYELTILYPETRHSPAEIAVDGGQCILGQDPPGGARYDPSSFIFPAAIWKLRMPITGINVYSSDRVEFPVFFVPRAGGPGYIKEKQCGHGQKRSICGKSLYNNRRDQRTRKFKMGIEQ